MVYTRQIDTYSLSSGLGEFWALSLGGDFSDPSDM